jgi:hypothetical protein
MVEILEHQDELRAEMETPAGDVAELVKSSECDEMAC